MTDVFVRTFLIGDNSPKARMRYGFTTSTLARWRMQQDAQLYVLAAGEGVLPFDLIGLPADRFHIESKREAERRATTDIYVIADDDCLILGQNFIQAGVDAMNLWPGFGILTATSVSDGDYRLAEGHTAPLELHAVGGIAFLRKGVIESLPDCEPDHVDGTVCDEIVRRGYKCGVLPWVKFNHLGAGYSLTTKGIWAA